MLPLLTLELVWTDCDWIVAWLGTVVKYSGPSIKCRKYKQAKYRGWERLVLSHLKLSVTVFINVAHMHEIKGGPYLIWAENPHHLIGVRQKSQQKFY